MPSSQVKDLLHRFDALESDIKKHLTDITELKTEIVWIKRIVLGAAGLGFIEKLIGWMH